MKKSRHLALTVIWIIVGTVTVPSLAQDRGKGMLKLPSAGSWARYHSLVQPRDGKEQPGTFTLRSLNTTTIDGVACRWMESDYLGAGSTEQYCKKSLIPEVALRMSDNPSTRVVRELQRFGSGPVSKPQPEQEEPVPISSLYLPGFLKNSRRVDDPKSVKHENGLLEVQHAYVGTHTYRRERKNGGPELVMKTEYRVWLHPDLPVGFAHASMTTTMLDDEKESAIWELEYTLEAFGDGALPAIVEESVPAGQAELDSK